MTHEWTNPSLPLTDAQRMQPTSGVLPSGEANMYDFSQKAPINKKFPDLSSNDPSYSGVLRTYPEDTGVTFNDTGIFHYDKTAGQFSSPTPVPSGLGERLQAFYVPDQKCNEQPREDYTFRVQDSYIHHKQYGGKTFEICFLSSYMESVDFDRYNSLSSYYNAGY